MDEQKPVYVGVDWGKGRDFTVYSEPGRLMQSRDGRVYEVQKDGSWRRIHIVGEKKRKSA
jgi:hypothetical protein